MKQIQPGSTSPISNPVDREGESTRTLISVKQHVRARMTRDQMSPSPAPNLLISERAVELLNHRQV